MQTRILWFLAWNKDLRNQVWGWKEIRADSEYLANLRFTSDVIQLIDSEENLHRIIEELHSKPKSKSQNEYEEHEVDV